MQWLVPTGLALFGGGLALVAIAALGGEGGNASNNTWAAMVVIGATAMVFGMCCAAPLVVERIGRLGRRASLSWRMALRSLGRSRARSAAVVAAIAVTVGGAVAMSTVVEATIRANGVWSAPSLPPDAVVVSSGVDGYYRLDVDYVDAAGPVDRAPLDPVEMPPDILVAVESLGDDIVVEPLLTATFDPAPFNPEREHVDPTGPGIATPALLDALGLSDRDRSTLLDAGALETQVRGAFNVLDEQADAALVPQTWTHTFESEDGPIIVEFPLGRDPVGYDGPFGWLMTEDAAAAAGFDIVQTGLIVRTGAPLDPTQLELLRSIRFRGDPYDVFVEPGDPPRGAIADHEEIGSWVSVTFDDPQWRQSGERDLWIARLVIVGAALVLSLLVVAIGLALAAAEGRDERDTLLIAGARPASMRRLTAARAAVIAAVGIVLGIPLGIPLGYAPVGIVGRIVHDVLDPYSVSYRFPWLVVVALLVVIPTMAAGGAWCASGLANRIRPPRPSSRDW